MFVLVVVQPLFALRDAQTHSIQTQPHELVANVLARWSKRCSVLNFHGSRHGASAFDCSLARRAPALLRVAQALIPNRQRFVHLWHWILSFTV